MHHLKFKFIGILKVFTQYALILRRSVETAEFIIGNIYVLFNSKTETLLSLQFSSDNFTIIYKMNCFIHVTAK
jgi:hypothetical protein